ncbi:MAG: hypothetical protein AAGF92_07980 [Myxococcota bacterium]
MQFEQVTSLLKPEALPYLSGVERLPNGMLHVAVLTRMPGVSPAMIEWWFSEYMRTPEHYKRWHPRDHVWMAWEDKSPGTHVGAKHLVHERIGGRLEKLCISFVAPTEFLGDALAQAPGAIAVCARTGLLDWPVDVGRMVHLAVPRPWGCELHSRFWLGYVAPRGQTRLPVEIANAPWVRRLFARSSFGRELAVHCHEEMSTLAGFLPALHAVESRADSPSRSRQDGEAVLDQDGVVQST